ncbi:MAG: ADP-ribosylglycohydrolase family protein [Ruminococcaceae bacterium]|nr:ADP-ribosylglycohydrolase family protein [Oscillospiraceae bacterium]
MKMRLNREEYYNKVKGCWIGKNIGGTIGAPFEGTHDMPEIEGYTTPKGQPLPNDDLDLQLVWLNALRDVGPRGVDANVLADYWLTHITPHWGEYGICKGNMFAGLLPPLCGEYRNDWKNSNGAWIRSEIWACVCPGIPDIAVKYAIDDACIDHGRSEGTYAEIFTAVLESLAFVESDINTLIQKALDYIPETSRLARSVNIVIDGYKSGEDWKVVRNRVVEDNVHDLDWFMAPANVAFVVLGLLYGEGDFKKSMIYTVGCGDDTDCTAATCGAIMGIMSGADAIPEDWKEYIGDTIVTKCINASYIYTIDGYANIADTCTELTKRVVEMMPKVMDAFDIKAELVDGNTEYDFDVNSTIYKGYAKRAMAKSPYSFEITTSPHTGVYVEYEKAPEIKAGETFKIKAYVYNKRRDSHQVEARVLLPEGWSATYPRGFILHNQGFKKSGFWWEMDVTANENVNAVNKIDIIFDSTLNAVPVSVPLVLFG